MPYTKWTTKEGTSVGSTGIEESLGDYAKSVVEYAIENPKTIVYNGGALVCMYYGSPVLLSAKTIQLVLWGLSLYKTGAKCYGMLKWFTGTGA